MDTSKLLKYSMQLAMLRQLLTAKKITESEHQQIERKLKKDYGIISNITSCISLYTTKGTRMTEVVQWK